MLYIFAIIISAVFEGRICIFLFAESYKIRPGDYTHSSVNDAVTPNTIVITDYQRVIIILVIKCDKRNSYRISVTVSLI